MFWNLYMGGHAFSGDFTFAVGFVAALMLFSAVAWNGLRAKASTRSANQDTQNQGGRDQ